MTLVEISSPEEPRRLHWRKLDWITECLVHIFYMRCNISMQHVVTLFGIGMILVHNVVYAWTNVLCDTLVKFFLAPSRSQMLRAYLMSNIKKFDRAHIYMLLDAAKIGAETAFMKTVNTVLYSAYKHGSTMK